MHLGVNTELVGQTEHADQRPELGAGRHTLRAHAIEHVTKFRELSYWQGVTCVK